MEVASVSIMSLFIYIATSKNVVEKKHFIQTFFNFLNVEDHNTIVLISAIIALTAIILGNSLSIYLNYKLTYFSAEVGHELGTALYKHYLLKPYIFYTTTSSSKLINNIYNEVSRVFSGIIAPLLNLNAKLILSLLFIANLLYANPKATLAMLIMVGGAYLIIFQLVKKFLELNGRALTDQNKNKYTALTESFSGIKEIKQIGIEKYYYEMYFSASLKAAYAYAKNTLISITPKFILETVAFGGIAAFIIFLLQTTTEPDAFLSILSLFAITGYKLLPALQMVFGSITSYKGNLNAFINIKNDLTEANQETSTFPQGNEKIIPLREIKLTNIMYSYPNKHTPAIQQVSISITPNTTVGFVGLSGSGKTTTADVILGILSAQHGEIICDDIQITNSNFRAWQNSLAYVPQSIFLANTTILENVSLGIEPKEVNHDKIIQSLSQANIYDHVKTLSKKEYSYTGEKGVQLSGGQRQRIGIARALYRDTPILIFDEATSALDGISEKKIMDAIYNLQNKKTIILIAHRLSTVKNCNTIYLFDNGQVVDTGSYDDLMKRNALFQKMANQPLAHATN